MTTLIANAGDWTLVNVLQLILAIGSVAAAVAALLAVRASNRVAEATEKLATHTEASVNLSKDQLNLARDEVKLVGEQLKIGERQVEAARLAIQSGVRPLLANVPWSPQGSARDGASTTIDDRGAIRIQPDPHNEAPSVRVSVPIRNIGAGPAVIDDATIESGPNPRRCESTGKLVAPSEVSRLVFVVPEIGDFEHGPVGAQFRIWVMYTDVAGEQLLRTELFVSREKRGVFTGYSVTQVIISKRQPDGNYVEQAKSGV